MTLAPVEKHLTVFQKVTPRVPMWHSSSTHRYIPRRNENGQPHKIKILDLKTKHDQIIKKSSISNVCWFSVQKWWHKNKHIKLIFQVLIVKNHFFVIQPLKCKMFTKSLTIARTYTSACLWVLWPVLRGSPKEFLPQQNWPHALVRLPPTVVGVDDLWLLCSINYHRHVGHHHWPFDK